MSAIARAGWRLARGTTTQNRSALAPAGAIAC
jgi:hypothetical protein